MKTERSYLVEYTTRCTQTMVIHACTSAAAARRKLLEHHKERHPDVEAIGHESDQEFPKGAKIGIYE